MKDSELKEESVYWAEIVDPERKDCGRELKVKFTSIFCRDIEQGHECFYLTQLRIIREVRSGE